MDLLAQALLLALFRTVVYLFRTLLPSSLKVASTGSLPSSGHSVGPSATPASSAAISEFADRFPGVLQAMYSGSQKSMPFSLPF